MNFGPSADDRETPLKAIQDISPILNALALYKECSLEDLRVYDPYYCNGNIKTRLQSLGLNIDHIQNEPIDCYQAQKKNLVSPFDILVSNPPYSGDHIRRCLQYSVKSRQPWLLLLPSNVLHRSWFSEVIRNYIVMYVAPFEKYVFEVNNTSESHIPMVTIWFIGIPNNESTNVNNSSSENLLATKLIEVWNESRLKNVVLARSFDELPRKIRKLLPFTEARANKNLKRKKEKSKNKETNKPKKKK